MSPSKTLFFFCLSFIVGIFLELIFKTPQIIIYGFLILAIISIILSLFVKKINFIPISSRILDSEVIGIFGFCILFIVLGLLRAQVSKFNVLNDKLSKLNGQGEFLMEGVIINEPDIRDTFQKIKVEINQSTVLVTTNRYPEYQYLDKIKIIGKLETPSETKDFSYKNYLMKDGIYSVINFPKIDLISKEHKHNIFSYLYEKILFFKQKVRQSIRANFLPPQSFIMEGTILGDNGAMSNDLKNKLNITGLRHIIAVSGTHVVILASIIMSLLLAMGLWRGQAFYISIIFIFIYILLTGLPPSGVRAGIMGGAYLLSQKIGRQSMSSRLIILACAIMLLINPLLLLYDVGFQLSFLAVLGLIYLEPVIKNLIKIFTKDKAENFITIVSTTISAQIFTLPIMIYNFGNISFVSPITNLLILPIVYWLMIFGFLTSILGVFSGAIGWLLAVPCWFLLNYFIFVMDFFSQQWMAKTLKDVSWIWLIILYLVIIFLTVLLRKKYAKKII